MATKLFLKSPLSSWNSAYGYASSKQSVLALVTSVTTTTASGTKIQCTKTAGGTVLKWISPPLSAAVTISGTVTFNLWAREATTSVNCTVRMELVQYTGGAEAGTPFAAASLSTELTASVVVNNWTVTPTSTNFAIGDRIVAYIYVVNVGTMGSSASGCTLNYAGPTAAAAGDSWFQFTEAVSFQSEAEFIQSVLSDAGASVSLPGVSAAGNAIVVLTGNSIGFTPSVSDTKNTYTQIVGPNTNAFEDYVYVASNIIGGTTLTFTFAASSNSVVAEYGGVDPNPVDKSTKGTGTSTAASSGATAATTVANEIVVGTGFGDGASNVYTAGTGFVGRVATGSADGWLQDKSVTATGAQTSAFTTSPSGTWRAEVVTLKWGSQPAPLFQPDEDFFSPRLPQFFEPTISVW